MTRCEGAYRSIEASKRFVLEPEKYPGGVSLWGTVEPVYNSTGNPAERGIHVHARFECNSKKAVDWTFDAVELPVPRDLLGTETVVITRDTAVAYYLSRFLKRPMGAIFCPKCNTPHLDSDWFAVKPHRLHLCHGCNELFKEPDRLISNPLEAVRHRLGDHDSNRTVQRANKSISLRQSDYAGGMQLWASNPALLWTSTRPEEAGIHLHAFEDPSGMPIVDDTFDQVRIDGMPLDEEHLRHFMAQNALYYLRNKIVCLRCPVCNAAKFDRDEAAFRPKSSHSCDDCGNGFNTPGARKLVVSNPFVETVKVLELARSQGKPS